MTNVISLAEKKKEKAEEIRQERLKMEREVAAIHARFCLKYHNGHTTNEDLARARVRMTELREEFERKYGDLERRYR